MTRNTALAAVAAVSMLVAGVALSASGLLGHSFRPLAGKAPVNLEKTYGGQVLLVVNTASKCGFTPQFEALEALHAKYKGKGFAVLGFPSGDFREQEFTDEKQIQEFCTLTYGVKFPMFEKVQVRGDTPTPLYADMIKATGEAPGWNFHKYLIDRSGRRVVAYTSLTGPGDRDLQAQIEEFLKQ